MVDFTVLKQSGLQQQGELSLLFNVSRVTVNGYANNKGQPRGKRKAHSEIVVQVLEALIAKGKLPLAKDEEKEARDRMVERIAAAIQKLTNGGSDGEQPNQSQAGDNDL